MSINFPGTAPHLSYINEPSVHLSTAFKLKVSAALDRTLCVAMQSAQYETCDY